MNPSNHQKPWQFWIDRGGTFTDVVGMDPGGKVRTHKLLSENPRHYKDAAVQGICDLLGVSSPGEIPPGSIDSVKMGTTVATNALLERRGEPTVLVITRGFADALRIGYQNRPRLFALDIELPEMLYNDVIEADERMDAHGNMLEKLDSDSIRLELQSRYEAGLRSVAIAFMHGYRYPDHERQVADIAREIGFPQVSTSHGTIALMKLVSRGDTTVVDAYLSPVLRRYVDQVQGLLPDTPLMFMQSNGGLTSAQTFMGKNAILSGPAGGVVGMVKTGAQAGFDRLIGFDMGGTSTDVCHFAGHYERTMDTEVAGVRLRAPMMQIHTVAAGGGSILHYDGARFRVGPDSAGANPGPACYRNGGPLTITDCNVMLGKLRPEYFPHVFGPKGNEPLDTDIVRQKFESLARQIESDSGNPTTPEQVANGFLAIAIENMANAVKRISVQRGYDISSYALCSFGGAGGQHACLVADALGMTQVYLHPHAGVLSALGIGLAEQRHTGEQAVEQVLELSLIEDLSKQVRQLAESGQDKLIGQGIAESRIHHDPKLFLRYQGSDTPIEVTFDSFETLVNQFENQHRQQFGFIDREKPIIVEAVQVDSIGVNQDNLVADHLDHPAKGRPQNHTTVMAGVGQSARFYHREDLGINDPVDGPAVIIESTSTIVIEPGWRGTLRPDNNIVLQRVVALPKRVAVGTQVDPVMLEIFNNLFMNIAEQMGLVLANTSVSVNIKERLDFSCAIFDQDGELIANAPHMPVHLGSMSESIKTVIRENSHNMYDGDAFILNAPYNGGTHLPDITIIKPVFLEQGGAPRFYVASRGHHADVGGITPGSMPSDSTDVNQEGILLDNVKILSAGVMLEGKIRQILGSGQWPARNPEMNIADFKAQIAANEKGARELLSMVEQFGIEVVEAYMTHVQNNAEESVRRVLNVLKDGHFRYELDDGSAVEVDIKVDNTARQATIDFTGTSPQHPGNYNAPASVAVAAVLYVFRCLVDDEIPLNAGCLKPLNILIPEGCMVNPSYPAAVVAGNVETSQYLVDTLLGALGVAGGSQGTMNNFTWGNHQYQYYETVCGGAGATTRADGTSAVHTHMTNSRLTDPEILEWRFPVVLESFSIRRGSGGTGRHRGGDGTIRRIRFLEPMTANILAGHRRVAPYGMNGGGPGRTAENYVERSDGTITTLGHSETTHMYPDDVFVIKTPGGGGYGRAA